MWGQMVLLGCRRGMGNERNWTVEKAAFDYICPLPVTWPSVLSPSEAVASFCPAWLWR